MRFLSITKVIALLAVTNAAGAVDLYQYTVPGCGGNALVCPDIPSRACCKSTHVAIKSGRCHGCGGADLHAIYIQYGLNRCGLSPAARLGPGCVSTATKCRGHKWCRLCPAGADPPKAASELDARDASEEECEDSIESSRMTKDFVNFFKINYDVPQEDTDDLFVWFQNVTAGLEDLPEHLWAHWIDPVDLGNSAEKNE